MEKRFWSTTGYLAVSMGWMLLTARKKICFVSPLPIVLTPGAIWFPFIVVYTIETENKQINTDVSILWLACRVITVWKSISMFPDLEGITVTTGLKLDTHQV